MLGGAREEGPSMDVAFADYLAKTDLTAYAVVNPNSRTISISTAQYKKLQDQAANQVKPNETGEKELVPAVQTNTHQRTATIPVNVHKQFVTSGQKSLPETGTTDTTFISLLGFVVGLLGLSRFKKALIMYDNRVVETLKVIKVVYSDIPLNLQLLLYIFKIKYITQNERLK